MHCNTHRANLSLLSHGQIHIWQASLSKSRPQLDYFWQLLDRDEKNRANSFLRKDQGNNSVIARAILRYLLSSYINCLPQEIVFQASAHGKLSLAPAVTPLPLQFNLSHSGDIVMYALVLGRQVGVDVENICRDIAVFDIAQRFFSRQESSTLLSLDPTLQSRAFFNCWTRKEAFIKAIGWGLSYGLDKFTVDMTDVSGTAQLNLTINDEASSGGIIALPTSEWSLFNLPTISQYCAALVVEGQVAAQQVVLHDFSV